MPHEVYMSFTPKKKRLHRELHTGTLAPPFYSAIFFGGWHVVILNLGDGFAMTNCSLS